MGNDYFDHEGDQYCSSTRFYPNLPRITAIPVIKKERERAFIKEKKTVHWFEETTREKRTGITRRKKKIEGTPKKRSMKVPVYQVVTAPRICSINKMVNWPFKKWGGYQAAIVGTYGSGKSNLLNLMLAFHLAQNIRILMFNDRRFEARHLADKGYFDKNDKFHPFHLDVFLPEGYEFELANPMWEHRKNVHLVTWQDPQEIKDAMKPHKLTVVYTECFDQESAIKLWMDLMQLLGNEINPNKNYMFAHHEFSSLIPEVPTKEIAKTVREAAEIALNLRKDRIGLLTTFHMLAEVFYRFSQKYTYVIHKRPVMRRRMNKAEHDARNFRLSQFNVMFGGRWMKHDVGLFPEIEDKYRLIPAKLKLGYPDLEEINTENGAGRNKTAVDPVQFRILQLKHQGYTIREISDIVPVSKSSIGRILLKLGSDTT